MTLKTGLGFVQGHCKWRHLIDRLRVLIIAFYNCGAILYRSKTLDKNKVFGIDPCVEYGNSGPTEYRISVEYGDSAPTAVLVISVEFILLIPTVLGISVESTDSTPPVRVPGICKLPPLTPDTIGLDISVGDGVESCEIIVGRFISGLS